MGTDVARFAPQRLEADAQRLPTHPHLIPRLSKDGLNQRHPQPQLAAWRQIEAGKPPKIIIAPGRSLVNTFLKIF
jgi:hypothetical protein